MSIKIYKITNRLNRKIYVGQTKKRIEKRFLQHAHTNSPLGNAMKDCGIENFIIEIIEECETQKQANERERFWIKVLDCKIPNGYNRANGGGGYEHEQKRIGKSFHTYEEYKTNFIVISIIQKTFLGKGYPILSTVENYYLENNLGKKIKASFFIKTEISEAQIEWIMEVVPTSLINAEKFLELLFTMLYVQSEKLPKLRYSVVLFDRKIFNSLKEMYKNVTVDDYVSVILLDNKRFAVADEFILTRRNVTDNVKSIFI